MAWLPLPLGKCKEEKNGRVGGPNDGRVQDEVNGSDGDDGEKAERDVSRVERNGWARRKAVEDEEQPGEQPEPDGDGGSGEHVGFVLRRKLNVEGVKRREGRESLENGNRGGHKRSDCWKDGPEAHVKQGRSNRSGREDQSSADLSGRGDQGRKQSGPDLGERGDQGTAG